MLRTPGLKHITNEANQELVNFIHPPITNQISFEQILSYISGTGGPPAEQWMSITYGATGNKLLRDKGLTGPWSGEQQTFYAVFCLRSEVPRDSDDVCIKHLVQEGAHCLENSIRAMTKCIGHGIRQTDWSLTPGFKTGTSY